MGEQKKDTLTNLELQIMQVIWRRGSSDVSGVQEGLEQELAYTTVQTMLNILTRKGKLKRTLRGRAYEYSAIVSEEKALSQAVRDLVDRMFGGSSEGLVMSLIKDRQIDAEKIARLSKKLDEELNEDEELNKEGGDK
jgi:BlaI family penicillinase repressor